MTLCDALLRLLEDPKAPFQLYLIVFRLMSYRTSTAAVPSEGEQLLVESLTSPGSLHALAVQRRFQSRVCTFIKCAERGCRAALFSELCRPVYGLDVLSAVLEVILSLSRSQEQCAVEHIGVSPVMVPEPQWSSLTSILIKSVDILMESDLTTPLHRLWFSREEAEGVLARLLCECPLLPVTAREAVLCVALGCWVPEPYIHHSSCGVPVLPSVKHRRGVCLDDAVPLSSSYLWRSQTAFYESEGNRAWDTGLVPFEITNSVCMATSVAAIIRRFAAQASLTAVRSASVDTALKTVYVLELGSGHCKFGYHLARALLLSPSPDVRIKVLLSDFDEATLRATAALPCFKPLLDADVIDFCAIDASTPLLELRLLHSGDVFNIRSRLSAPLFVIGNYLLDSIPCDMFRFSADGSAELGLASIWSHSTRISPTAARVPNVKTLSFSFQPHTIKREDVLSDVISAYASNVIGPSLLPSAALNTLEALRRIQGDRHPFGLLIADKCFTANDCTLFGDRPTSQPEIPHVDRHGSWSRGCYSTGVDVTALEVAFRSSPMFNTGAIIAHGTHRTSCLHFSLFQCDVPGASVVEEFTRRLDTFGPECMEQLLCHLRADDAFASSLDVGCWLEVLSLSCYDWTTFKEFCWLIAAAVNSTDSEDASVTTVKRRKEDTDVTCTVVDIGQRPLAVAAMTAFGNRFQAVVVGSTDEDADVLLVSRWLYVTGHTREGLQFLTEHPLSSVDAAKQAAKVIARCTTVPSDEE